MENVELRENRRRTEAGGELRDGVEENERSADAEIEESEVRDNRRQKSLAGKYK